MRNWVIKGLLCVFALVAPSAAIAQLSVTVTGTQTLQTLLPGQTNALCFKVVISNPNLLGLTLQSIRFTNKTVGPGTQAQLDAELGQPKLYRDSGDGVFQPVGDGPALMQTTASGGFLTFSGMSVAIASFGSVTLFVATDIPPQAAVPAARARDGDNLDLSIQAFSDLTFAQFVASSSNSWPVDPAGSIAIDGSSAAQFMVAPVGPGNILAGTNDNLALDVRVPANGYQTDLLQKVAVINEGTATLGSDIAAVRAWVDDGDGVFNLSVDRPLGTLTFTGDRWQLTGLSENVPLAGARIFFTVDLKDFATDGHTVRLALPTQPDVGIGVASTNDGPLDQVVRNPNFLTVSTADRITLTATALPSPSATPGQAGVLLASVVAANSYSVPKTLSEIAFTNGTTGPGSRTELDSELGTLSLRYDGNGDGVLGTLAQDPLLGTAHFQDGEVRFTGVVFPLAAGQSRRLFLTGDLSVTGARDGDQLAASIQGVSQVVFDDSTRVLAVWPVDSGARVTVDGMVAAQITTLPTPAVTLGKNEGPALVFDFLLPRNGYQSDALNSLSVVNLGTAGTGDLAEVRLWRDGGDGLFTPGSGDDSDLGAMAWQVNHWQSAALSEPLVGAGTRFFVSITVSGSPVDSATVRLAIPVGGVANASGNDGPLDAGVSAPNTSLLSNAPLLVSIQIQPPASAVGQPVSATMVVRNVGPEAVNGITPSALVPSGTGGLSYVSGPQPPSFNLSMGAADSFHWTYTAASAGDVKLTGGAGGTGSPSGSPRNSLPSASNTHQVYTPAQSVAFSAASTLPPSVNRGQTNVAATSLQLTNPGGAQASPVRILGLRVRLEDGAGAGIVPSGLLGRVVVSEGGNTLLQKTALETSGSVIDLTFTSSTSIAAGAGANLTVAVDLLSSTTVPEFRLSITDSTAFQAVDALSGAPVAVTHSGSYPVRTSVASVVAPATALDFTAAAPSVSRVGRGQAGVPLLGVQLQSPGIAGISSDVRLFSFSAVLEDTNGATVPRPADFLGFVRVETPVQVLLSRAVSPAEGPDLAFTLSLPLSVPANTPLNLTIRGDISGASPIGPLRLRLLDSTSVDARDANTHTPVPAVYNPSSIVGNTVLVEGRADTLRVAGTPRFPVRSTIGATQVPAMRISLRHPGSPGTARIALGAVTIQCRDEARRPLVPSTYLSRVAVFWNGALMAEVPTPPGSGGSVTVPLPNPLLEPGELDSADVVVDFSAASPTGSIELMVFGDDVAASDADLGTAVTAAPEAGEELPLVSGLCRLETPPRDLVADLESRMPAALAPDGRAVVAGLLTLSNVAPAGADSILVDHLTVRASDRQSNAEPIGVAASSVAIYVQGTRVGQSGALTSDSTTATVPLAPPLRVAPGSPLGLELRWTTALSHVPASFRLGCDAAGVGVVQPASAILQVQVSPVQGKAFPLWSAAGVFGGATLAESYSNFPNPFAGGRASTAFAYYLRDAARVTLRILTPAGEGVATLVADGARPAGMNQIDLWDGRNGTGAVVRNGVYVAELSVAYADGSRDHARRKVAVVR